MFVDVYATDDISSASPQLIWGEQVQFVVGHNLWRPSSHHIERGCYKLHCYPLFESLFKTASGRLKVQALDSILESPIWRRTRFIKEILKNLRWGCLKFHREPNVRCSFKYENFSLKSNHVGKYFLCFNLVKLTSKLATSLVIPAKDRSFSTDCDLYSQKALISFEFPNAFPSNCFKV